MSKYYKIKNSFPLVVVFFLSVFATSICSAAGDIKAGKVRAEACVGCHGVRGITNLPNFPNLAGQKELYLVTAINNYRTGARNDPTMNAMVAPLTDEDAANIAAYFSSLDRK